MSAKMAFLSKLASPAEKSKSPSMRLDGWGECCALGRGLGIARLGCCCLRFWLRPLGVRSERLKRAGDGTGEGSWAEERCSLVGCAARSGADGDEWESCASSYGRKREQAEVSVNISRRIQLDELRERAQGGGRQTT